MPAHKRKYVLVMTKLYHFTADTVAAAMAYKNQVEAQQPDPETTDIELYEIPDEVDHVQGQVSLDLREVH